MTVVKVERPRRPVVRLIQALARLTDRDDRDRHCVRAGDRREDHRGLRDCHRDGKKKSKDRDDDRVRIRLRLRH